MALLLEALETTERSWSSAIPPSTYLEAIAHLNKFADYKKTSKRAWVKERQELVALYSNIQTKLKTYALTAWEPKEGLRLEVSWIEPCADGRIWTGSGRRFWAPKRQGVAQSTLASESESCAKSRLIAESRRHSEGALQARPRISCLACEPSNRP